MRLLRLFALLFLPAIITNCASKTVIRSGVPSNCMRVQLKDFTKPCKTLPNGDLLCDGVRVHVVCVQPVQPRKGEQVK
jgi:hypothetical protein